MNTEDMYGLLEWPDQPKKKTEPVETEEVEEAIKEKD